MAFCSVSCDPQLYLDQLLFDPRCPECFRCPVCPRPLHWSLPRLRPCLLCSVNGLRCGLLLMPFRQFGIRRHSLAKGLTMTKIKFDTHLTRGKTRERDEDSVLSRIASLRTNPPCRPISNILIWRNEGTLPSCHTRVVIFTQSGRLGTAVPISLTSPTYHLPVVHFSIS